MPQILEWFFASLFLLLAMLGSSETVEVAPPPSAHVAGVAAPGVGSADGRTQADTGEVSVLDLLDFVPNTPEAREWITLGDADAWHEATGIPRIASMDEASALSEEQFDLWAFGAPGETTPPAALGMQYLRIEDLRGFIGLNYFDAMHYVEVNNPPDTVAIITARVSPAIVADVLLANDYEATQLDGAVLYSKGEDYEIDLRSPTVTGRLGGHNRIAILDAPSDAETTTVIIAKATHLIEQALAASQDDSLFDNDPFFGAVTTALQENAPDIPGNLTGLLFMNGAPPLDPATFLTSTPEQAAEQLEALSARLEENPLSPWLVGGFATHRDDADLYLSALLAFLPGTDAEAEAASLAERMANYEDPDWAQPFSERWSTYSHGGTEVNGTPVAWVTMKVGPREWNALQWMYLIMRRDYDFLIPAGAP